MLGLKKSWRKMEERGLSSSLHGLDFLSSGLFSSSPTKFSSSPTTTSTFCSFHHQHPAAARYHLSQSLQL